MYERRAFNAGNSKWDRRGPYRDLVGKREGKKPLERPRRRWDVDTKMGFK